MCVCYNYGENCAGLDFSQPDQMGAHVKRHAVANVHQHEHGAESDGEHFVPVRGDVASLFQRRDVSSNGCDKINILSAGKNKIKE